EPQLFPIRWPVKAFLLGYCVWFSAHSVWKYPSYVFNLPPKHPLQGIYTVDHFVRNGETIAARVGDSTRWQRVGLGVDSPDGLNVRMDPSGKAPKDIQVHMMNGHRTSFGLMLDTGVRRLVLTEGPAVRVPMSSPRDTIKRPRVVGTGTYGWEDKES